MHSFALLANMKRQCSWQKISELRKILKDKKTRVVKGKDGKIKGGVDFVDGSNLYNKYSKELADLEAKMARAKESRPEKRKRPNHHNDGHNKKQLVVKEVVRSDQMPLMHGQLASLSSAADDWNDTEVGEESEMDSQHDFQECTTSPTKPRWLDEQTEIPKE